MIRVQRQLLLCPAMSDRCLTFINSTGQRLGRSRPARVERHREPIYTDLFDLTVSARSPVAHAASIEMHELFARVKAYATRT